MRQVTFTTRPFISIMFNNSVSIDINASPETIYSYLVDFTRHAEWSSNVQRIELTAGEMGKVGAEYEARENIPREMTTFARITALHAPTLITWQATDKRVFKTEWSFEIQARGELSRLTQRVTFHPLNLMANVILYVFRVPRVEKENRASLERIKSILEK